MKKNLFLLFSIYFFVVQPVFAWLLWQDINLLILSLINFVVILVILLVGKAMDKQETTKKDQHTQAYHEDKDTIFSSHHESKKAKKTGWWKGVWAIVFAIVFYILLVGSSLGYKLIISSAIALILLFFVSLFTKNIRRFFSLAGTKILLFFLGIGIIVFGYQFSFLSTSASLKEFVVQNINASRLWFENTTPDPDAYVLSGEGSVIGSGVTSGETSSDIVDLFSGMQGSDVISETPRTDTSVSSGTTIPAGTSLKMWAMIKSIITKYNIPLIDKKDVKFTYVSTSNELYPYFRTAYAKTLIGSSTNPDKLALCETYITMKWIIEKWNVTYTKTNVLQQYWNYAKTNNLLNGCEWGKVVKEGNL